VTHRGLASGFLVVSGHDERTFASAMGAVAPNGVTLVVLMGLARIPALAARLVERGWTAETPAAIIVAASTPAQQAWRGRLGDLAAGHAPLGEAGSPGTIVIGEVVSVADAAQFHSCTPGTSDSTERVYVSRR
jgi:siroheme synthase